MFTSAKRQCPFHQRTGVTSSGCTRSTLAPPSNSHWPPQARESGPLSKRDQQDFLRRIVLASPIQPHGMKARRLLYSGTWCDALSAVPLRRLSYVCIVVTCRCPSRSRTLLISVPESKNNVATVARSECGVLFHRVPRIPSSRWEVSRGSLKAASTSLSAQTLDPKVSCFESSAVAGRADHS